MIKEALTIITIPLLRYMMKLKLNYYMAFRTDGDKGLQDMIAKNIRHIQKLIDNKHDVSAIDAGIAGMKKDALVNKQIKG